MDLVFCAPGTQLEQMEGEKGRERKEGMGWGGVGEKRRARGGGGEGGGVGVGGGVESASYWVQKPTRTL